MPAVWLLVVFIAIVQACITQGSRYEYGIPVETNDGWKTASLAEKGIDAAPLISLMDLLKKQKGHLIHGILLAKDGALVFEEYFDGEDVDLFNEGLFRDKRLNLVPKRFTRDEFHYCASVTKSVTSQVFGIAVDQGYVSGVDGKMFEFFPDYAGYRSPEKDVISIHNMLSMTTGLPFDEQTYPIADPRNDAFQLFFNEDPVAFVLGKSPVHPPGTVYQYNSGTTVLLGEIIRRATGKSVSSFAEEHLFKPLEISSYAWAEMPGARGIAYTAGGLYLRPRDMAKIGQLMLQGGVWNGHRILSQDWVNQSVVKAISVSDGREVSGYGYQWRLGSFGGAEAFWAAGWGGQYIVVLPGQKAVFVQTGGRYGGEKVPVNYIEIIEDHILPAIEGQRFQSLDLTGEWTGHVILGNGTKADIRMSLSKGKKGYTGIIRGDSNTIPEMSLQNVILERNRLAFEVDFPAGQKIERIRFDLRYRDDTLKGSYTDPTGDSDEVSVRRMK